MMPLKAVVKSAQPHRAVERSAARVSQVWPYEPAPPLEVTMMRCTVLVVSDRAKRPERNCQYHIKPCAPAHGGHQ